MKKNGLIFLVFFCAMNVFSKNVKKPDYVHNYERILEEAQILFDENSYGDALKQAEKARNSKKEQSEYEIYILENSFKPAEVKRKGDSINSILEILQEREDFDAIQIIKRNFRKYGAEFFDDSKAELLSFIRKNAAFPEADFLMGKIYCLEGEYSFAYEYFSSAYKNSEVLEIPDEKYDILYELANVSQLLKKDEKYEEFLLLILSQSKEFKDETFYSALKKTSESTRNDCLEKFFSLYRCDDFSLLKAYFALTDFYMEHERNEKALKTCQLGAITAYTKIVDVLKKRNADFEFAGLSDVLQEAQNYPDIVQWGIENNIWKGFYTLAELNYLNSNLIFSVQLFNILKEAEPEDYWKQKSSVRLAEIIPD